MFLEGKTELVMWKVDHLLIREAGFGAMVIGMAVLAGHLLALRKHDHMEIFRLSHNIVMASQAAI